MEMVMILIGKRLPSQRLYETREMTGKEEMSSRMSSSSSSTRIGVKKGEWIGDSQSLIGQFKSVLQAEFRIRNFSKSSQFFSSHI
jgi:hypothetical protein